MQQLNFDDVLDRIVEKDRRYHRDAYVFLREALEYTQKSIAKANKNQGRHISGQELLNGIREYALGAFGPMTVTVLEEWGVKSCEDFGLMVFVMVENNLLRKTDQDSLEDFKNGYDFGDAFRKPFLPTGIKAAPTPKPDHPDGSPNPEPSSVGNN